MTEIADLMKHDPREIWAREDSGFTPWLCDEIDRLAEVLGAELEVVERESGVGDFAADIVARDLGQNSVVVIENQLDPTDHGHLGQLVTYAAGKEAKSVVWICREFREEHRKAMDWLNEHCRDVDFFGIVLEVLTIGGSPPAPNFRLVAFPNDWARHSKETSGSTDLSERQKLYRDFFQDLIDRLREQHNFTRARKAQPQNWYSFSAGQTGFKYGISFARGDRLRAELYIDAGDGDENLDALETLKDDSDQIEQRFESDLEWERLEDSRACRVAAYRDGSIMNTELHETYEDWAVEQLLKFENAFSNRLGRVT